MTNQKSSNEAKLVLDSELKVCAANRAFYELFKLAPEECIGTKVYELGGKAWDNKLRAMLEAALDEGSRSDHFELLHDDSIPGHGILWLTAKTLPSTGAGDQILLSIEDLTASRSPEDSLAIATDELKRFAEVASRSAHELNNMLTVVRMNAELLQPELARNGLSLVEAQDIIDAAIRAEALARQLLVSSRRAFPQPTGLDRLTPVFAAQAVGEAPKDRPPELIPAGRRSDVIVGSQTILLVDDEKALRKLTGRILAEVGYRILEAADGAEALRIAAGEVGEIDLVLTDVEMPTLGGRGLVAELSELSPGIKVLFMSGYTDNEILRRGIRTAKTHFRQKPFTPSGLRMAVQAALTEPAEIAS